MNLCRDCKFAEIGLFDRWMSGYEFAKCNKEVSPVTGKALTYCCIERRYDCGIEGKWFEPRKRPGTHRAGGGTL